MRKVTAILTTDGCGYWSEVAKDVKITGINLAYVNDEQDFGELRVYFDTKTWNVNKHGLIYTDRQFDKQLKALLTQLGLEKRGVDYSEQGMQGDNYVSYDVDDKFIKSYTAMAQLESML